MSELWGLFVNLPYLSYCLLFEQPNRTYDATSLPKKVLDYESDKGSEG